MTQPPVRKQPGIPIWVWILAMILVIAALWWILAADEPAIGLTEEPLSQEPVLEESALGVPAPNQAVDEDTRILVGAEAGTDAPLDTTPVDEPPPPAP